MKKIKFKQIPNGYVFLYHGKELKVGDVAEIPKDRAESFIARGIAEEVKEAPKEAKNKSKE